MTIDGLMKFEINLKLYQKRNNLSLKELAKKLEVPMSTAHGWVNGVPPKSIKTIKEIAGALDMTFDELCFGEKSLAHETDLVISIGSDSFRLILKKIEKK